MLFARLLLWLNGVTFIATGGYGFSNASGFAMSVGYDLQSAAAFSEFLANYGGLYLFYGCYLVWCGIGDNHLVQGLTVLAVTSLGLLAGRIAGFVSTSDVDSMQLVFSIWEGVTAILCVVVWRQLNRDLNSDHMP